jgi:hypothetical protein
MLVMLLLLAGSCSLMLSHPWWVRQSPAAAAAAPKACQWLGRLQTVQRHRETLLLLLHQQLCLAHCCRCCQGKLSGAT